MNMVERWVAVGPRFLLALRRAAVAAVAAVLVSGSLALGGCDVDSFLDPSEVGRYENTPVVLPILQRLDVIEEPEEMIAGLSEIRSEDLIPEIREYVMGPGDMITVTIYELISLGAETNQTRRIDELGFIRLPVIGQIKAAGQTTKQLEQRIVTILDTEMGVLRDPIVTVIVQEGRQRTYSILGTAGSGTYTIVQNNFRLLDAIALAGGLPVLTEKLYVIRQVPLAPEVEQGFLPATPEGEAMPAPEGGAAQPGAQPGAPGGQVLDPGALIERLSAGLEPDPNAAAQGQPPRAPQPPAAPLTQALDRSTTAADGRFINVNGKWVWVEAQATPGTLAQASTNAADSQVLSQAELSAQIAEGTLPPPSQLVTQRVIEVDGEALMRGEATQNIVVRPGDVIRVPTPLTGNVYVGGSGISRPGTYGLPGDQKLTLKQLIISAGGLSPVGIPERVDIIRRLGKYQEAYLRLNYRAIAEGVQPDIFLKPDDTITVGTNVFASHLAVIRNSFRSSYGFGFLLDRNFGSDIFGASPESLGGRGL